MIEQFGSLIESAAGTVFFDRCPLDVLAFTLYSFEKDGRTACATLVGRLLSIARQFDAIFYCPVAVTWPPVDFPGPTAVGFALLMDWYMRRAIRTYQIEVVMLPWALEQRQPLLDRYINLACGS